MGPTAGSSGLALIIGISEGTLGGLVGVQAFFAAADHVAVWGAPVKSMKLFGYPHFSSYRGILARRRPDDATDMIINVLYSDIYLYSTRIASWLRGQSGLGVRFFFYSIYILYTVHL